MRSFLTILLALCGSSRCLAVDEHCIADLARFYSETVHAEGNSDTVRAMFRRTYDDKVLDASQKFQLGTPLEIHDMVLARLSGSQIEELRPDPAAKAERERLALSHGAFIPVRQWHAAPGEKVKNLAASSHDWLGQFGFVTSEGRVMAGYQAFEPKAVPIAAQYRGASFHLPVDKQGVKAVFYETSTGGVVIHSTNLGVRLRRLPVGEPVRLPVVGAEKSGRMLIHDSGGISLAHTYSGTALRLANTVGGRLPEGDLLADGVVVARPGTGRPPEFIELKNTRSDGPKAKKPLFGPDGLGDIQKVVALEGRRVALIPAHGPIQIWDAKKTSGNPLLSLDRSDTRVGPVAATPDGRFLIAVVGDELRVWETTEGAQRWEMILADDVDEILVQSPFTPGTDEFVIRTLSNTPKGSFVGTLIFKATE